MNKTVRKSRLSSVPRVDSLLHRLQHAAGQEGESYLDQLMIFLDHPPVGSGDRWKKGAEMCAAWGVSCSHTAVYRLFQSYAIEWRSRIASEGVALEEDEWMAFEREVSQILPRRICEILTDPDATPESLLGVARLEFRKRVLEFAREKFQDSQRTPLDKAIATLRAQAFMSPEAHSAIDRLKEALVHPTRSPFHTPMSAKLETAASGEDRPNPPNSHASHA